MRAIESVSTVEVPENVVGTLDGRTVTIKGEKGELVRDFSHAPVVMKFDGKTFTVSASWPRKREAAIVGTVSSHIKNMIKGVTNGYTYKLKIVYSHFPITVKIEGKYLTIANFTGERNPRKVKIMGTCNVQIKGDDIVIQGISLEDVSQTAANIQDGTKIKSKDPRVFLDGIYVFEEHEGFVD
ncbi:MAG: 50S ribosomal protein L6 [archaeon]|jgi:large subunit ribosomal protein L6|nr:50S ribosomal protein L6 [Candidatus Bathyarchaeum sp.]